MSSIGGSAQVDYLIDSILEPNKSVKENYHALLVTTKKGHQLTGIKVAESKLVQMQAGQRQAVAELEYAERLTAIPATYRIIRCPELQQAARVIGQRLLAASDGPAT